MTKREEVLSTLGCLAGMMLSGMIGYGIGIRNPIVTDEVRGEALKPSSPAHHRFLYQEHLPE